VNEKEIRKLKIVMNMKEKIQDIFLEKEKKLTEESLEGKVVISHTIKKHQLDVCRTSK